MKFTEFTDEGGREVNCDFISSANANGIHLFAVADGMGERGYLASELAVMTVIEEFERAPALDQYALIGYISAARAELHKRKSEQREYDTADTTLAVLITNGSEAVYAHCGDTRIYTFRHRRLMEVTEDHSEAFERFSAGEMSYFDIRKSPVRHHLRRALGDGISWEPEVSEVIKIDASYAFLICTDGFWSLISEDEMQRAVALFSSSGWLDRMLEIVNSRISDKSDNLTAAAIRMQITDQL